MPLNVFEHWDAVDVKQIIDYVATDGAHGSIPVNTTRDAFEFDINVCDVGSVESDGAWSVYRYEVWHVVPLDKYFKFKRIGYDRYFGYNKWDACPIEDFGEVKPIKKIVEITEWEKLQ